LQLLPEAVLLPRQGGTGGAHLCVAVKEVDVIRTRWLRTAAFSGVCVFCLSTARAQFSADYQTNIISGVVSNWQGGDFYGYVVGSNTSFDVLQVENGGSLSNGWAFIGRQANASNNSAIVTGSNSMWNCSDQLFVGYYGSGNTLIVSNGAMLQAQSCSLGFQPGSSNNTAIVTGQGSIVRTSGNVNLGDAGSNDQLVIRDGAAVIYGISAPKEIGGGGIFFAGNVGGTTADVGDNSVLVTDPGSIWSTSSSLEVGATSYDNSLIISNGGHVINGHAYLGSSVLTNNTAVVTGAGSLWKNDGKLRVSGALSRLTIADSGSVWASNVFLGGNSGYGSDFIQVRGGTLDVSSGAIIIGLDNDNCCWDAGELNVWDGTVLADSILVGPSTRSLATITMSGGLVQVKSAFQIGGGGCVATDIVEVAGGTLLVTNAAQNAVLEVRNGSLQLSGGSVIIDKLVITNSCAHFIRTGGTLVAGNIVLDPNMDADGDGIPNGFEQNNGLDPLNPADANADSDGDGMSNLQEFLAGTDPTNSASVFGITRIVPEGPDIRVTWATAAGKTNALQSASAPTDSFADSFTVTNTVGSVTNYLDVGAAADFLGRFYRVRLVP
jgi:autotransporter family porin